MTDKLKAKLDKLNKMLAPGITATLAGTHVHFSVRSSKTSPLTGTIRRVQIGTFTDYEKALRAMLEYKFNGYLKEIPAILAVVGETDEVIQENELIKEARLANEITTAIASITERVERTNVDVFDILNNHNILDMARGKEFAYQNDNGDTVIVPADAMTAYFNWFDAGCPDLRSSD